MVYILKTLGYKDIVLIGTNDTLTDLESYNSRALAIHENGLNLIDIGEKIFLPQFYTREEFQNYAEIFKAIKETGCTCFIILLADN